MIRQATKFDKTEIINMMKQFRSEADLPEYVDAENEEYWNLLLDTILVGKGVVFLEEGKGLLMALIHPTIWDNRINTMQELAWYVKPEFRNTTVGYRLLKSYIEYGDELKEDGRIKFFSVSKMDTSPDVKYQKFGFRKKDENWIK
ncbi:MAG: GNAT family N-acetyltransferase [Bacteroidota bacterium]